MFYTNVPFNCYLYPNAPVDQQKPKQDKEEGNSACVNEG